MNSGRADTGYGLARLNLAASPLFLREAEVARGIALLQMGAVHLAAQADGLLREVGIGRAHARLLAHVVQWPGNAITDFVPITATSKQALGRVARDLERRGLIEILPGMRDRRQRLLFASAAGERLSAQADAALSRALAEAYAAAGQNAVSGFWRVLEGMVPVASHAAIAELARRKGSA
ncbi:MAG: MarR family transcriptional regulator [Sphingomonadaceae bacterium]|nr:MarR family transcriptional regulator [Sphingomonadaceae bacterium]